MRLSSKMLGLKGSQACAQAWVYGLALLSAVARVPQAEAKAARRVQSHSPPTPRPEGKERRYFQRGPLQAKKELS